MANVYLDTSFFIGFIENQAGRREEAQKILQYELDQGSQLLTSTLTDNEFLIRYFALFEDEDDPQSKLDEVVAQLRSIAEPYPVTTGIARKAAEIQHIWRGVRRQLPDPNPRDRRFRWDAIHLATADALSAARVYAWDARWQHLPGSATPRVGSIISPALCPNGEAASDETA